MKIFCDCADLKSMLELKHQVDGFTTNPTLMRNAGITNYEIFAKEALKYINKPICFEVLSDDFNEMESQARKISSWGENVYVKIPIVNTHGESMENLIGKLSNDGIKINVTAVLTFEQAEIAFRSLSKDNKSIISVFAGRIADTGRNPELIMMDIKYKIPFFSYKNIELLWASTREIYNITQAKNCGCDIITVTPDILKKLSMKNKDLRELSIETVKMFYNDAKGFNL